MIRPPLHLPTVALALVMRATVTAQGPCGAIHYGTGTAGTAGIAPSIAWAGGEPKLGNQSFALRANATLGGVLVGQVIGFTPTSRPVLGIDLLVDAVSLVSSIATGTGPGTGQAVFPLPIPNTPTLAGLELYSQIIAADAGAPQGLSSSDGIKIRLCTNNLLCSTSAYQGAASSDAFCAIHNLGSGRIIAGKRSSSATNRFRLSDDFGQTWKNIGCPGSTGAHSYFFGQNGSTVFSGTGDTGNACLMRSRDRGLTWSVALTSPQLRALTGSTNVRSVFSPVYLGSNRWITNLKCLDTRNQLIESFDNGASWRLAAAQPGQRASSWARQMILTSDKVLMWPSVLTDKMYLSYDFGASWSASTVPGASLFQPLCDAGNGVYFCGDVNVAPNATLGIYRSLDRGRTWSRVTAVNLQRQTVTYWRDIIAVKGTLLASACCHEGTSSERFMQLFRSLDGGSTWCSYGNPFIGPYGGMQAIYQMCATDSGTVFAACQPDSTILRWPVESTR